MDKSQVLKILRSPANELNLSSRVTNVFERAEIQTITELVGHTEAELLSLRGFGFTALRVLNTTLSEMFFECRWEMGGLHKLIDEKDGLRERLKQNRGVGKLAETILGYQNELQEQWQKNEAEQRAKRRIDEGKAILLFEWLRAAVPTDASEGITDEFLLRATQSSDFKERVVAALDYELNQDSMA